MKFACSKTHNRTPCTELNKFCKWRYLIVGNSELGWPQPVSLNELKDREKMIEDIEKSWRSRNE